MKEWEKQLEKLKIRELVSSDTLGCENWNVGGCSKCYKVKAHFDCGNNLNCALNTLWTPCGLKPHSLCCDCHQILLNVWSLCTFHSQIFLFFGFYLLFIIQMFNVLGQDQMQDKEASFLDWCSQIFCFHGKCEQCLNVKVLKCCTYLTSFHISFHAFRITADRQH